MCTGSRRVDGLLEEIVEGLARARRTSTGRGGGPGLTFNGRSRRKERAEIALVLRRHACRERLRAFEPRAGIERHAIDAAVDVHATPRAASTQLDRNRQAVSTSRALEDLMRRHEIGRLRT